MSELVIAHRRQRLEDGAIAQRTVLTDEGLVMLFQQGWRHMQQALHQPDACFVGAVRDREDRPWRMGENEPHVIESRQNGSTICQLLYMQPALAWFAGHFPGRPMVPGVAQIDVAGRLIEHHRLADGLFAGLDRIKFAAPIVPETVIKVHLQARADSVWFAFESATGKCSEGSMRYADAPEPA